MQRKVSFLKQVCSLLAKRCASAKTFCSWAWLVLLFVLWRTQSQAPTAREPNASLVCAGIQQLLLSLEKLSPKLEGREDDIQFLKDMLQTEEFHSVMRVWKHCIAHYIRSQIWLLFQIHKEVSNATASPVWPNALSLVNAISYDAESGSSDEEKELFALLSSPQISVCHTKINIICVNCTDIPTLCIRAVSKTSHSDRDLPVQSQRVRQGDIYRVLVRNMGSSGGGGG